MWESVAMHVKNFSFESTVHPKNVKGTLVFNDASINVVTSVKMQQSWFSSYLFFSLPLSDIVSAYWGKKCFSKLHASVFKIFLLLCGLL